MLLATFHMSRMTIPHSVDSNKSHGEKCHCSSQEILYPNILLQNRHNFTFLHSFQTDHHAPETGGSRNFTTSNGGLPAAGVRLEIALKTEQRVHNGKAFTEHRAVDFSWPILEGVFEPREASYSYTISQINHAIIANNWVNWTITICDR